jgi:hypothetical protein
MDKILHVIRLMTKTGLFFANADGCYCQKEEQYISNFLNSMAQIGDLDAHLQEEVNGMLGRKYSLDEILTDTRALVEGFTNDERAAILNAINGFIGELIRADGHVHPLEEANYKLWKGAFGLE